MAQEISMSITKPKDIDAYLKKYLKTPKTPVILRTANTGIDYYYSAADLRKHFLANLEYLKGRDAIYLFNRFILYKAANRNQWQILGEISEQFAAEKYGWKWQQINWNTRRLKDGFKPSKKFIKVVPAKG